MKKLDDMLPNEKEGEHQVFDAANTSTTCDCCSELPTVQPVTRRKAVDNEFDDEEHGHSDNEKKRQLLNDKLLIIIGLALTIGISTSSFPHNWIYNVGISNTCSDSFRKTILLQILSDSKIQKAMSY
jgi:hypothetical protein